MIGAANDVGDAHIDVIDYDAELVGGDAVGAQQDEIFDGFVLDFVHSEDGIFEFGHTGFGNAAANRVWLASGILLSAFLRRQINARTRAPAKTFARIRAFLEIAIIFNFFDFLKNKKKTSKQKILTNKYIQVYLVDFHLHLVSLLVFHLQLHHLKILFHVLCVQVILLDNQ